MIRDAIFASMMFADHHWYIAPFIECKNRECRSRIPLPFDELPPTSWEQANALEDRDPRVLPPDGWSASFGCFECGVLDNYSQSDVFDHIVPKLSPGKYHSDARCFCVEGPCGHRGCTTRAKLYVETQGETENDLRDLLNQEHFRGLLPCGHDVRRIDKRSLRLTLVMKRLW